MKEIICEERLCTGCSACSQACPQGAVAMEANNEGFLYPRIDEGRCTDCGLCGRICPVNKAVAGDIAVNNANAAAGSGDDAGKTDVKAAGNGTVSNAAKIENAGIRKMRHRAFACYSKDDEIRSKSTSGGAFTQLALKVLSAGGIVFGAGFDENFNVRHCYIENESGLDGLRRSKYVQSAVGNTFKEAEAFLREGRDVLFCGTPCQIAGLKAYLRKDYKNLLACDLVCSGVPSPKVWSLYLDYMRKRFGSGISSVSFRDKSTGWSNSSMKIVFKDGSLYTDKVTREIFFIGFGKSIFNRKSCYECKFRLNNTKADLTLADFWGIDRRSGDENSVTDDKGVSLVITHTEAGENALSAISGNMWISERGLDEAVKYNPRMVSSVAEPAGRKSFFGDMAAGYGFDWLRKKYMDNESIKYKLKCIAKHILGRA